MPILADCHMHSIHSGDSKTPMEEMVLKSIAQGLTTICFTEHNDFGFPITDLDPKGKFECNADTYFKDDCYVAYTFKDFLKVDFEEFYNAIDNF